MHLLVAGEMGAMGKFIIKKQCGDLGLDPDAIRPADLRALGSKLATAVSLFTGPEKAERLKKEIMRLARAND